MATMAEADVLQERQRASNREINRERARIRRGNHVPYNCALQWNDAMDECEEPERSAVESFT